MDRAQLDQMAGRDRAGRTQDGGREASGVASGAAWSWRGERVWKLRDLENLYDIGLWDDIVDVFRPEYVSSRQRDPDGGSSQEKAEKEEGPRLMMRGIYSPAHTTAEWEGCWIPPVQYGSRSL